MSDLATLLDRLAPDVDLAAGRAEFEARRSAPVPARAPDRRRRLLVAACVAPVVAGAVGVWAVRDRSGSSPAGPQPTTTGVPYRVISVAPAQAVGPEPTWGGRSSVPRLTDPTRSISCWSSTASQRRAARSPTTAVALLIAHPGDGCEDG